ncbi:MAG: hypothetical protein ABL927_10640 [Bdellovibrionales bacterium]
MNIQVEHIDTSGALHNRSFRISRTALAKHMAIAGQGYAPKVHKLIKTVGMYFHYTKYIQKKQFYEDKFSEPPVPLSDPTEKAQFSNLAGKAIADFLSKRIDNSLYTVNYEAAMKINGHLIKGMRPDLIAYSPTAMFALEAKGRHHKTCGNMSKHKKQAKSGPISVNFSVACVSYNMFNKITCKYRDPFNQDVRYDNRGLQALTKKYYKGLSEFLNPQYFDYREFSLQGEEFYEVELFSKSLEKFFPDEQPFRRFKYELFDFIRPCLILPKKIFEYAEKGINNETTPFIFENESENNYLYIDNDRIGLRALPVF